MNKKSKNRIKWLLVICFFVYFINNTFFTHTHLVDGVLITHSHPFNTEGHTHSNHEFLTIAQLSNVLIKDFPSFSCLPIPFFVFIGELTLIRKQNNLSSFFVGIALLRAPPYSEDYEGIKMY